MAKAKKKIKKTVQKTAKKAVKKSSVKKAKKSASKKKAPLVARAPKKKAPAKRPKAQKKGARKTPSAPFAPAQRPSSAGPKLSSKLSSNPQSLLTPLDDRLVVRLAASERKTSGGLFIPDTVSDISGNLEGVVVACGKGHRSKKGRLRVMDVQHGDRVVFSAYAGSRIRLNNEDFVILRESEVTGVLA